MPYYLLEGMNLIEGQENTPTTTSSNDHNDYECIGIVKNGSYINKTCDQSYLDILNKDQDPIKWCKQVDGNGKVKDSVTKGGCYLKRKESIDQLNTTDNITNDLMKQIIEIKKKHKDLYSDDHEQYVRDISKMSLTDLGDPSNSEKLDFIENVIINFLDIPDNKMGNIFKDNCDEDLNLNILSTLTILYQKNKTEFNNISDNNLIKVDRVLNKLGRYLPDVFQKILTGMKMCNPEEPNKYAVLEHIYKTMFKFNNTTVNLGLMDGISQLFSMLRGMKTIEMVVLIIAIAFVISKVFDMFRVKVDV